MTPVWLRAAIALVGAALLLGSFVARSSVDRGTSYHHAKPAPPLTQDAGIFVIRIFGAFLLGVGLVLWVAARSFANHTGIF